MCGIFGIIAKAESQYSPELLNITLKKLAKLSESRGKDSSGLCFRNGYSHELKVLKGALPISKLIGTQQYNKCFNKSLVDTESNNLFAVFGHARLVTNGTQLEDNNNQPVVKDGIIGIHNGIIVNVDELWVKHNDLKREYEIDTEVFLAIVHKYLNQGLSTSDAVSKAITEVFGTVATALFFNDRNDFILATNNGSLYVLTNLDDILIFASEVYILKELIKNKSLSNKIGKYEIKQVDANSGYCLNLNDFNIEKFLITDSVNKKRIPEKIKTKFSIDVKQIPGNNDQLSTVLNIENIQINTNASKEKELLVYYLDRVSNLKRCSKCLLPETFPFIEFDEKGVCNICNNYVKKNHPKPLSVLEKLVEPYRRINGQPEVIIPYSGGRDSTYVLHIVKKHLGLNPIAYTYDWGMVTDLARRNIARVCGKLGVENIIVAADLHYKRANIKKNISAWLKKPELGMIPLFMAGDKYFFYYCDQLKKQTGIKLNIWGVNYLENTDFKVGFCGIPLDFEKKRIYSMTKLNQLKLFGYVGKNLLMNPAYLNRSIWDTLGSFAVRYIAPRKDYYHMFDYYRWDEKEIENLLINEYNWETALDTNTTWRIGDGTAGFYNYLYFTIAGFSEYDTFRSNQIREGMITREEALKKIMEENRPRFEAIKWYLDIIGMDYERVIKRINEIPKLY